MHRALVRVLIACTAVLLARPAVAQQSPGVELGIDGAITHRMDEPRLTVVQIPVASVRAGFFLSPAISFEPALGLVHASEEGSYTTTDLTLGLLYHFRSNRSAPQPYVRPFVEVAHTSNTIVTVSLADGSSSSRSDTFSTTATTLGAGLGIKLPIDRHFAARFEGNFGRTLEHQSIPAANELGFLFGFSFFTGH